MKSQKFRDTRTGEIVTQIPLSEIQYFEEVNDTEGINGSFLYDDDATQDEVIAGYQELINSGDAWRLEGHVGRTAMGLIESGHCMLGEAGHRDYWGNYVPSRTEVKPGTKGSPEFCNRGAE